MKALFFLFFPLTLWAGSVLPLPLGALIRQADRIFVGRCLGTDSELEEHRFPSVLVHFEVIEAVAGTRPGERLLLKQFGENPSLACRPGEEFLLFLYPDSRYGFTSPVGLGQGKMRVHLSSNGQVVTTPFPHLLREVGEGDLGSLLRRLREWKE